MNANDVKKMADDALKRLSSDLEKGRSETLERYLAAMSRFHDYSLGNVMLIVSQRATASRVAGFHTWRKFGRSVRRGEKGIAILAPVVRRASAPVPATAQDDEPVVYGFRTAYVFDVDQTDGASLPEPARVAGEPGDCMARLKEAVSARGIQLEYSAAIGAACGLSVGGRITLRPGLSPAEEFTTLVHEFAHELLHQDAKGRAVPHRVSETEAEAVAYVVCEAVGLQSGSASSDYIQLHAGDQRTLTESLERIRRTAAGIIGAIRGVCRLGPA